MRQTLGTRRVTLQSVIGLLLRPCIPARPLGRDAVQADAIHWARGDTELTTGANGFDDGVHGLVGSDDGIHRANFDAQRATDTPVFINDGHRERALVAILRVQWLKGVPRNRCQPRHTRVTTGWTLVDSGFARVYRGCVCQAVGVAAPRALRLRQCAVDGLYLGRDGGGRCHAGSFSARGASLLR